MLLTGDKRRYSLTEPDADDGLSALWPEQIIPTFFCWTQHFTSFFLLLHRISFVFSLTQLAITYFRASKLNLDHFLWKNVLFYKPGDKHDRLGVFKSRCEYWIRVGVRAECCFQWCLHVLWFSGNQVSRWVNGLSEPLVFIQPWMCSSGITELRDICPRMFFLSLCHTVYGFSVNRIHVVVMNCSK